jgi:hypothetical protein
MRVRCEPRPRCWCVSDCCCTDFAYFNGHSDLFLKTRPLELLFRDPWWITTTVYLFVVIKTQYELTLREIFRISPRFGIMLAAMLLSITFVVLDVLSVTGTLTITGDTGINPFWKLSFVFKCLTDAVILDDFKMALDRLRAFKISRLGSFSGDFSDRRTQTSRNLVETWEQAEREARKAETKTLPAIPSSEGQYSKSSDHSGSPPLPAMEQQNNTTDTPDQHTSRSRFMSFDLGDMVPSAIEDGPLRRMGEAHLSVNSHQEWVEDAHRLGAESDYADALRDISPQTSASRGSFSQPFHPT